MQSQPPTLCSSDRCSKSVHHVCYIANTPPEIHEATGSSGRYCPECAPTAVEEYAARMQRRAAAAPAAAADDDDYGVIEVLVVDSSDDDE